VTSEDKIRAAFEKWYGSSPERNDKYPVQYLNVFTQARWEAWQAALQSGEPVAYWNKNFTFASFIKLADHIEGEPPAGWIPLYTTPQPVVPALTLEDLNLIRQWHNAVKDAYVNYLQACDADTFAKIEALLSAGKGGE